MSYLLFTTLIHKNCLCAPIGFGAVLHAISMYRAGVGL